MKKLIASMFGLSLLALLSLGVDSRTNLVDGAGLQLLTHCGECEKDDDSGDDEDSLIRLLTDCGEDHGDDDGDDEDSLIRLLADDDEDGDDEDGDDDKKDGSDKKSLAHCGECEKDDDSGDDEDSLLRLLADCGEDHGDDDGDDEDSLV